VIEFYQEPVLKPETTLQQVDSNYPKLMMFSFVLLEVWDFDLDPCARRYISYY